MQKQMKNGNFYLGIAILMMVILFISSSMTYQQQSQVTLIQKLLANEPLKEFFSRISFNYAGSEVSISAKGYVKSITTKSGVITVTGNGALDGISYSLTATGSTSSGVTWTTACPSNADLFPAGFCSPTK